MLALESLGDLRAAQLLFASFLSQLQAEFFFSVKYASTLFSLSPAVTPFSLSYLVQVELPINFLQNLQILHWFPILDCYLRILDYSKSRQANDRVGC